MSSLETRIKAAASLTETKCGCVSSTMVSVAAVLKGRMELT